MRSSYKIYDPDEIYFVTSTIVEWIPVFSSHRYFKILLDTFKYCQTEKDLHIIAYVIMPEHFHFIVQNDRLKDTMKSIKSFSAKKIIERLEVDNKTDILTNFQLSKKSYKHESKYQIWQESFHPQQIFGDKIFQQKVDYIHFNPVKRGLVDKPEDWRYSSAGYYFLDRDVDLDIYVLPT